MTIVELRKKIGQELGYGSLIFPFDGTAAAYSELSADEQITLTNAMKAYIRDHPGEFNDVQNKVANTPDIPAVETYGVLDAAKDFGDEVLNQAEQLNPLSEQNRGKTAFMIFAVVAIAAGAYFFAKGKGSSPLPLPKP